MSGNINLEINSRNIQIYKESDEIVIKLKASLHYSLLNATSSIHFINPELLSNLNSEYSVLFKSNVVIPPPPPEGNQHKQTHAVQSSSAMVEEANDNAQTSNTVEHYKQDRSNSENRTVNRENSSIQNNTSPQGTATSSASTSFRRNIFSTSAQSNSNSNFNQNTNSLSQSNNGNAVANQNSNYSSFGSRGTNSFQYSNPDQRPSQNSQGNMFIIPNSQQTPSIFDRGSDRGPSNSDRGGVRSSRSSRTRIQ